MSQPDRIIRLGVSYDFGETFTNDGGTYDMTGKVGRLRLLHEDGTTTITRLTSTAAQFTWTDQSAGTGTWHIESNEDLTTGKYVGQIYVEDASSPVERDLGNEDEDNGRFYWTIIDPETGSF